MDTVKVMVNGLPGNMARTVAQQVLKDARFSLLPYSLTGPEIEAPNCTVEATVLELIGPDKRESRMAQIKQTEGQFLSVDYTHPSAVNANAAFYCSLSLPFVMGTTGGDRGQLEQTVRASSIAAVIAPNMAKQIVGFQAMMEFAADNFPGLFKGYSLEIKESHQKGKADTSGTAKAMVRYFKKLGITFAEQEIIRIRDPEIQQSQLGVPEKYLAGHGWHTYTLISPDRTVRFEFTHNVNGRQIYAAGTLDALQFLAAKTAAGSTARVYNMIDVLKGV